MNLFQIICTLNLVTLRQEQVIVPSYVKHSHAEGVLSTIRNQTWGRWAREQRTVLASTPFSVDAVSESEMKYIVVEYNEDINIMLLFSKSIEHAAFYEAVSDLLSEETSTFFPAISAGFTDLKTCYGRSESLNKDSQESDNALLQFILN